MASRVATIVDVARAAGVSRTTASAALGASGRISEATRLRVTAAADRLGYVPNTAARHLRRGKLGALGLYLPDQVLGLAYYMNFAFGAVQGARERGFAVTLLEPSPEGAGASEARVDGFIAVDPLVGDGKVEELLASGLPLVTGEAYLEKGPQPVGVVESDHAGGMRKLLAHLADQGAARPVLIAPDEASSWARLLRRSYRDWCEARGVGAHIGDIPFNATPEQVREASRAVLAGPRRADAIISATDGAAIGVLGAAHEAGRHVGEDLLVASCVDSTTMELASPPITALDLRPREFGRRCALALIAVVQKEPRLATLQDHPIDLVVRASTTRA